LRKACLCKDIPMVSTSVILTHESHLLIGW
jgi:hypothetical protein